MVYEEAVPWPSLPGPEAGSRVSRLCVRAVVDALCVITSPNSQRVNCVIEVIRAFQTG